MLYLLFGLSLVLLITLIVTAAYQTLQKKEENEEEKNHPTINTSGGFSIVRKPANYSRYEREISMEKIKAVIIPKTIKQDAEETARRYHELWNQKMEENISVIEKGDKEGVQTYRYQVPETESQECKQFAASNIYVTREQIQNFPNIIPPFHLGCRVKLVPKHAWNTNLDGTGWKPLITSKNNCPIPDWRTIGKLD